MLTWHTVYNPDYKRKSEDGEQQINGMSKILINPQN
jgi:hypothetical protein